MDEFKHRAGEKLEALQVAAVTAAGNGKTRVQDAFYQTSDTFQKIRDAFNELWNHELIAEGRARIAAWSRETIQRIRDGAPPLSPVLLYEELLALFHDRVWRKSVVIFTCGAAAGGAVGILIGLRVARRGVGGPHARALHSQPDQSVILVEDAVPQSLSAGEVLVRVQAFSVCQSDRRTLRGRGGGLRALMHSHHITVGRGFAGVVLDVGHGVTDLELGDEVWGVISEWSGGAASELLTIRSTRLSKRPRSIAADGAASLPWAGGEALAALRRLKLPDYGKGKRVAVCGARSGEGCVLVQVLSSRGALTTVVAPRHAAPTLKQFGAHEYVDMHPSSEWAALESRAKQHGPWDAVLTCDTAAVPAGERCNIAALIKATAPRRSHVDLRPSPLISDSLPAPFYVVFAASFYIFRVLRWMLGCGCHTDFLEDRCKLREGLSNLAQLVDSGALVPVLDKVYLPQEFESALAHACSDEAIGTTVVRFP